MDDLSRFCCQDPACPDYGLRDDGNLTVCMRYGAAGQDRLLYCRTCQARFSEHKGTPLFGAHLPTAQALAVLRHLAEGCGIRQTSRLVGVSRKTVTRYARLAGEHAQALHDELVALSPPDPRGPVRREVVLRRQEGTALRSRRAAGRPPRG